MPVTPLQPWIDGLLYLLRPSLSVLLLGLTVSLWREDRRQSSARERHSSALPVPAGGWWIEVRSAGLAHSTQAGAALTVDAALVVGRSPECGMVFEDPAVSARHLRLTPEPTGCRVEPLCGPGQLWLDGAVLDQPITGTQDMLLRLGERVTLHLQRAPTLHL